MSANQQPFPGAVDTRRASLTSAGQMARWAAITSTVAGFAHSGTGEQRRIYVPLATPSLAGALSAADKARIDAALTAVTTDANGWDVDHTPAGKRVYRRRFLNQTAPVATEAIIVAAFSIPAGFASAATFDRHFTWNTNAAGTVTTAPQRCIIVLRCNEASTTMDIAGYMPNATNMSTVMSNINCFVELIER